MTDFTGTGLALITPFNEDLSIDFPALERLVNYTIENGVEYFVVLGTTAENATLSEEESEKVIQCIVKANNKRLPLVLGIGGNNTEAIKNKIRTTDTSDFEAILSVCPYYNKPTQEGIYQHYKAIASATDKKIILYNVPGRTVVNINPETTLRLANEFSNIIAIKEASPNYLQSNEIIRQKPANFSVISGDDEITVPMTLAGGKGVISVIGQALPKEFSQMVRFALEHNVSEANKWHYKLMEITRLIYVEGNPAGVKALLALKGICKPHTRLPLVEASAELTAKIKAELDLI